MRWSWTGRPSSFRGASPCILAHRFTTSTLPLLPRPTTTATATRRLKHHHHHQHHHYHHNARLVYVALLTASSGLVLASSYLTTAISASFALDRPLHTIAVVLLLSGLAIVAYETWALKNRRPNASDRGYVAIPLAEGNGRPSSEETWPLEERPVPRGGLTRKAIAMLLVALLFLLGARIALVWAVLREVECAGPTLLVRICRRKCAPNPLLNLG